MRNLTSISIIVLAMTIGVVWVLFPDAPRKISYSIDALIAVITIFIFAKIIVDKSLKLIPVKYMFVLACFAYICVTGIVLNSVSSDTAFAGVRVFFRYVPVFLLPFAFQYDERSWRITLAIMFGVLLLQIPITIWQRFFHWSRFTGDVIGGTYSSSTSISLLSCVGILFALTWYLCQRLSATKTLLITLGLLIPPSLAETKITPILLLIGGGVLVWVLRSTLNTKRLFLIGVLGSLGIFMFASLYNFLYSRAGDVGYIELMTDPNRNYHYKGVDTPEIEIPRRKHPDIIAQSDPTADVTEEEGQLGRLDSIAAPFTALGPKAPLHLLLGLGIGNTSSSFGTGGAYRDLNNDLSANQTTISFLIWETGLLGCMLYILFLWFVTRDILDSCNREGTTDVLAVALLPTASILWVCLAYTNLFFKPELMIPFCYLAGLTIANSRRAAITISTREADRASFTMGDFQSSVKGPSGSTPQHF